MKHKRFWFFCAGFFFCVNTLAGVLCAGLPALDDGGGFITLSPLADLILWGPLGLFCGVMALFYWRRQRPYLPAIPRALAYPAGYGAHLALCCLLVLVLAFANVFDRYGPVHLPFWGYVWLLIVLYTGGGFLLGARQKTRSRADLLWAAAFPAGLCAIGTALIHRINVIDAPRQAQIEAGTYIVGYTSRLLRCGLGGLLSRLNTPACVLLDTYEYAYYSNLGGCHSIPRNVMLYAVCLLPPVLFAAGWFLGRAARKERA